MHTKNLSLYLLGLIFLSGCAATGEKFRKDSPSHPDEALLYVYRPSGFIGMAQRPDMKIDGELVGSVVSGGFFVKKVAIGRHVLVLTGNGNAFVWGFPDRSEVINVDASGNYYYRYLPSSYMRGANVMVHSYSFGQVSEALAISELTNLNQVK